VIGQEDDFSSYKLLVAPMAYSLQPGFAERVAAFVSAGGTFVTTYLSGWTDENSLVFENGFLGPLQEVLGVWSEEFDARTTVTRNRVGAPVQDSDWGEEEDFTGRKMCELVHTTTAETLLTYTEDFYAGRPAFTVNRYGGGRAYYIASRNTTAFTNRYLAEIARESGVRPLITDLPKGVTAQTRKAEGKEWIFLMNATGLEQCVSMPDGEIITLAPWGVSVRQHVTARELIAID
jgi:beta-galactosidase